MHGTALVIGESLYYSGKMYGYTSAVTLEGKKELPARTLDGLLKMDYCENPKLWRNNVVFMRACDSNFRAYH